MRANPDNFRIFAPDELASNRLQAVLEVTDKVWQARREDDGTHTGPEGRVVEMLSEHQCQGWLEGYLLTGRHGLFTSYEAFIHIIDSMFNQHAKWLKVAHELPWRRPVASLNYLLSSHVWRQDHNGFSHQDPGFIDHVINKKAEVVRVYLPPDANTLLSTFDHNLRSRDYVNVVVAGKQPQASWLTMDQAIDHCTRGLGIWEFASNVPLGEEPDVVHGGGGRRSDARGSRRDRHHPHGAAGREGADDQRRRPDEAAAGERAPARDVGPRVRSAVHHGQADHLQLPRLPVAHPPPDLPPHGAPATCTCAGIRRRGPPPRRSTWR